MKPSRLLLAGTALAAGLLSVPNLMADTVGTKDGSTIQGKIVGIHDGVVEIATAFAGTLKIQQTSVASLSTDAPVYLRYQGGNTIQGSVATAGGEVRVAGPGAWGTGSVDKVEAVWIDASDSPESKAAAALARKWAFEASLDLVGSQGNTDSLATSVGFAATLAGPKDKLGFYAAYSRSELDGETSTDNAKGGVDYSAFFTEHSSWYVREEIGTDKIKDIDFYSNTAAGLGYAVIKRPNHDLTLRAGLAYRYEAYADDGNPDTAPRENVSTPALDLGLIHTYTAGTWRIGNKLVFLPSLEEFANYRLQHDSFFEVPIASTKWKLRLGVANDYTSKPQPGKKKLDTTYYTRFVLSWK